MELEENAVIRNDYHLQRLIRSTGPRVPTASAVIKESDNSLIHLQECRSLR